LAQVGTIVLLLKNNSGPILPQITAKATKKAQKYLEIAIFDHFLPTFEIRVFEKSLKSPKMDYPLPET
jgi:hypothetical protein